MRITDVSAACLSDSYSPAGSDAVSDDVAQIFAAVAKRVAIGFVFVGPVVVVAFVIQSPVLVSQAIWISIASGLLSLISLVPGLVIGRNVSVDRVARASVATIAISATLVIRFVGTVALFAACRYHFGEESLAVIFLVIGWYGFLTSVEVHGLARGLTSLDKRER